jgi:PAS domain S-box-containing protein
MPGLFRAVVANAPESVIVTDGDLESPDGPSIRLVNPAAERVTGYSAQQMVGQPLRHIVLPDRWPEVLVELQPSRDSGKPEQSELFGKRWVRS